MRYNLISNSILKPEFNPDTHARLRFHKECYIQLAHICATIVRLR